MTQRARILNSKQYCGSGSTSFRKPGSASNKNPDPDQILSHNTIPQHSKRTEGERGGGLKVQEVAFLESLLALKIVNGKKEKHRESKK